jgi:hypothetical protein
MEQETISLSEFNNKIKESFEALALLIELYKSDNTDLTNILKEVENGRN